MVRRLRHCILSSATLSQSLIKFFKIRLSVIILAFISLAGDRFRFSQSNLYKFHILSMRATFPAYETGKRITEIDDEEVRNS